MSGTRVCVGAIAGAFGVRGDVRLKSFCAEPEAIGDYGPLWSEDGARQFELTLTGRIKNGLSARLSGVGSKEAADALRGVRLYAPRDALPALPDDEFYHADLVGLVAADTGGQERGRVKAVLTHGGQDVLELHVPGQRTTTLVPFTKAIVPTVDLAAGRIVIDPPEGLFD